ncbi:MAG: phosphatase PAP2 family protein [Bacteroidetes bacterium]|nr:phosphatase PAP2 family protein [Bacteroidota bacterium]
MSQLADSFRDKWKLAWQSPIFRKKIIIGVFLVLVILGFFPLFFQTIEKRQGILLHDWILVRIPSYDVSIFVFIIIWATTVLILFRSVQDPDIFLQFIWAYVFLCLLRMISITLIPLDPPDKLLPMIDPISNAFYGKKYITKDLFFSGHTSSIFLIFLCLRKKTDKIFALISTIIAGILLLIQHVHYMVDVIAAPFFTFLVYWLAKKTVVNRNVKS